MTNNTDQKLNPLLSVFVTLGTVIVSIVPIFANEENQFLTSIFVDTNIVPFAAVTASIVLVLLIWQTNSEIGRQVFTQNKPTLFQNIGIGITRFWYTRKGLNYEPPKFFYDQHPEWKVKYLFKFVLLVILFYSAKPLSTTYSSYQVYLSLLQFGVYVLAFYCLGIALGLTIWQSLNTARYNEMTENRIERIRETLLKQGIVKIDLEILHLGESFGDNGIVFRTSNKTYIGNAANDFQQVSQIKEVDDSYTKADPNNL